MGRHGQAGEGTGLEWVPVPCDCGRKGGQYLGHYDLVRCACGAFWWALRPRRDGRLVAYPWPGLRRIDYEGRAA